MAVPTTPEHTTVSTEQRMSAAVRAYRGEQLKSSEDHRIVSYLPLVHKIVGQVVGYLRPSISTEDLVSAGTIGLVKAARDFDPTREAEFKTYAYIRIRGAVIDELRSWSFTPPEVGKHMSRIDRFCQDTIERTGVAPSDEAIAQELGITIEKLYRVFENARTNHFLSIHGLSEEKPELGNFLMDHNCEPPSSRMERTEMLGELSSAIQSLPQKQRQIVVLYYTEQLTMKQIAEVMDLTESRVSQLHASALVKLSAQLGARHER